MRADGKSRLTAGGVGLTGGTRGEMSPRLRTGEGGGGWLDCGNGGDHCCVDVASVSGMARASDGGGGGVCEERQSGEGGERGSGGDGGGGVALLPKNPRAGGAVYGGDS